MLISQGESGRIPKAVLQKLCQRLGWEAPKYSKLSEKDNKFVYAVSILRGASGRGKSRNAGGFTTIQLPDHDETFEAIEVRTLVPYLLVLFIFSKQRLLVSVSY